MSRNDLAVWLKIVAILGAVCGAVLTMVFFAIGFALGIPSLLYWAAGTAALSLILIAIVAMNS